MNKPLMKLDIELWESAKDFVKHGIPWYMKLVWLLINPHMYKKITNITYARGMYDHFRNKIVLFTSDICMSVLSQRREAQLGSYHLHFALQMYYTLVHEMLHQANVAKDNLSGGHIIDFDRYEKLPEALKDIFDSLLEMEYSNDGFSRHPENRRKGNGKETE